MLRRRNAGLLFLAWVAGFSATRRLKKPPQAPTKGSGSKFFMARVDAATKCSHNRGLRFKKAETSAQRKQCEWFALWTTGPRLTG
jgi:hypothetical protein